MRNKYEKQENTKTETLTEDHTKTTEHAPRIGEDVFWHKSILTQTGSKLEPFPAKIIRLHRDGNFQAKDMAVDLLVFGQRGAPIDEKYGVMFSVERQPGRWTREP